MIYPEDLLDQLIADPCPICGEAYCQELYDLMYYWTRGWYRWHGEQEYGWTWPE